MKKILFILMSILLVTAAAGCNKKSTDTKEVFEEDDAGQSTDPEQNTDTKPTLQPTSEAATTAKGLYPAYEYMKSERKYGYINDAGTFVIEPKYDAADRFIDGCAIVTSGEFYQVINEKDEVLFKSNLPIENYSQGLAVFQKEVKNEILYGYIDTNGKVVLDPIYKSASAFNDDMEAIVSTENSTYSRIDKSGKVLETFSSDEYYDRSEYIDGYKFVGDDGLSKKGVIDQKGNVIFKQEYDNIVILGKDLFAITEKSDDDNFTLKPMAIFDKDHHQLSDYIYYQVSPFEGEYASASDEKYTYLIGSDGKPSSEFQKVEGVGTLKLYDEVIQADIDYELSYLRKDGSVLWTPPASLPLSDTVNVIRKKIRSNYFTLIYYPEIDGLEDKAVQSSINNQLKKLFERDPESTSPEYQVTVEDDFSANLQKDLLTVYRTGYDFPYGAAHGMPISDYYYFNIKTGVQYTLDDLFKNDSMYISRLNHLVDLQMQEARKAEDSMYFYEYFYGINQDHPFILTEDSLILYFYPYEVAAYAAGFPEFEIPYSDLIDMIDTEGELWNSYEHAAVRPQVREPELTEIMDTLIRQYEKSMTSAINIDSFTYVEPHLFPGSSLYNSQKKLVKNLYNKDIREEYVSSKVEKIEYDEAAQQYLVYVTEEIDIKYPEKDYETKSYSYIYTVNASKENHRYQLSDIKKWK